MDAVKVKIKKSAYLRRLSEILAKLCAYEEAKEESVNPDGIITDEEAKSLRISLSRLENNLARLDAEAQEESERKAQRMRFTEIAISSILAGGKEEITPEMVAEIAVSTADAVLARFYTTQPDETLS